MIAKRNPRARRIPTLNSHTAVFRLRRVFTNLNLNAKLCLEVKVPMNDTRDLSTDRDGIEAQAGNHFDLITSRPLDVLEARHREKLAQVILVQSFGVNDFARKAAGIDFNHFDGLRVDVT